MASTDDSISLKYPNALNIGNKMLVKHRLLTEYPKSTLSPPITRYATGDREEDVLESPKARPQGCLSQSSACRRKRSRDRRRNPRYMTQPITLAEIAEVEEVPEKSAEQYSSSREISANVPSTAKAGIRPIHPAIVLIRSNESK